MTMCICFRHYMWCAYFIYILYILCVPCVFCGYMYFEIFPWNFSNTRKTTMSVYIVSRIYGMHLTYLMSRYILYIIHICGIYLVCFGILVYFICLVNRIYFMHSMWWAYFIYTSIYYVCLTYFENSCILRILWNLC